MMPTRFARRTAGPATGRTADVAMSPAWNLRKLGARASRRGYTLIELVMASVSMTVVLAASVALIDTAVSAIPAQIAAEASQQGANAAVDMIADRLAQADSISSVSATAIGFMTPDTDGDGRDEQFKVSWSGEPGEPLMMIRNSGEGEPLVPAVDAVSFEAVAQRETARVASYESATAVQNHSGDTSGLSHRFGVSLQEADVLFVVRGAQGASDVRWSVDYIDLRFTTIPAKNPVLMNIYYGSSVSNMKLNDPVVTGFSISSADLAGSSFRFSHANLPELSPSEYFIVELGAQEGGSKYEAPGISFVDDVSGDAAGALRKRGDEVYSKSGEVLPMINVYGRVTSKVASTGGLDRVRSVRVSVQESDSSKAIRREVHLVNGPEL